MTKDKIEVSIETRETVTFVRRRMCVRTYCEICRREVTMVSPADAAILICRDTPTVFSLIEAKEIHFRTVGPDTILVCLRSLFMN